MQIIGKLMDPGKDVPLLSLPKVKIVVCLVRAVEDTDQRIYL